MPRLLCSVVQCFSVARAMGGSMPFQDALKARLDLMTPSKAMVERCLREHPPRLSPGAFRAFAAISKDS